VRTVVTARGTVAPAGDAAAPRERRAHPAGDAGELVAESCRAGVGGQHPLQRRGAVQGAAARVAELRRGAQPVEHGGEPGERGAVAVPRGGGGLERGVHEPEQREHPVALRALHRPLEVQDHRWRSAPRGRRRRC
jgi:hypothetical protein